MNLLRRKVYKYVMRLLTLIILLFSAGLTYAQDPVISLNIVMKDDDTGKKLSGATIVVKSGGSVFVTKTSASNGKVPPIDLPIGQNYTVYIQKAGYVTKVATVNGSYEYPDDLPPFVPFPIQTALFQVVEGVDFAWLETTPMIKFELDQYGNQTWDQAYTSDMLKKIKKLKEQMADKKDEDAKKKADFDAYVATGDKANGNSDYQTAIENYDKALALFDDATVTKKRDDAQLALDAANKDAQTEKDFQAKMAAAKVEYTAKNYEAALSLYKEATAIKPSETLPKTRIAEIEKLLKDQKDNAAKFDKLVADGDAAMGSEDFDKAISNYESALALKEDAGVKTKLENAKKAKADKEAADLDAKKLDEKYNALIADADKAFTAKTYDDAKAKYTEALAIKPNESHPAAQLSKIDEILKALKADEDAAKKLEDDYKKAIDAGDAAFASKDWDGAIAKYEQGLGLKPGEAHPTAQIKLANENKDKESAEKGKQEAYNKLMVDAKGLKNGESYVAAIAKYREAQVLIPAESEPEERIAEIEKIIAEQANAKEKEERYKALMAEGQDFQTKDELQAALGKYEGALGVKTGDAEAQKKIDEVKKLISEKESAEEQEQKFKDLVAKGAKDFGAKEYDDALKNYKEALSIKEDAGVSAKIKEIEEIIRQNADAEELKKKYDAAVIAGDNAFNLSDWEGAIAKYEEALSFMDDPYPKGKIAKAKEKIAENADELANQKLFKELVAQGDDLGNKKEYDAAIAKYNEAIKIKSDPAVSKKILDLKKQQEEDEKNKEQIESYKKKIAEADEAFKGKNWPGAKALYNAAIGIKGDEDYPKNQLIEIDRLIQQGADAELDAEFNGIIAKADASRDAEDYDAAIAYYEQAQLVKKSDPYPKEQIAKINAIKDQQAAELADKEAFDKKYKSTLLAADNAFTSKDYSTALAKYKEALTMKPDEPYPTGKIKEVEKALGELDADAAKETKYKAAIQNADGLYKGNKYEEAKAAYLEALEIKSGEPYPKGQIVLCNQKIKEFNEAEALRKDEEYRQLLVDAEKDFGVKNYEGALEKYKKARDLKPSETVPPRRIGEITKLLNDANSVSDVDAKYQAAIDKADGLFTSGSFTEAKSAYQDALDVKRGEKYPMDQILMCDKKMQAQSLDEEEVQYQKILTAGQENFNSKDYDKALGYYERAKTIRPSDRIPQQRIDEINQAIKDLDSEKSDKERFKKLVDEGDTHFERKEFKEAMAKYMDALDIFKEQYPKDQVEKCREGIRSTGDTAEKQYRKLIKKADEYYSAKNYDKAKGLYTRAVEFKPYDQYPKDQLKAIDKILNPPPKQIANSNGLTDYGPAINERPIDIEAMLRDAAEASEEFEIQKIYQQREDANQALSEWNTAGNEVILETKDHVEGMVDERLEVEWTGERGRVEASDDVDEWRTAIIENIEKYTATQEDDVQFQHRKVEAMQIDISENQMDNDVPRQQYELDVEKIKLANQKLITDEAQNQDVGTEKSKDEIDIMVENHVVSDANNDVARQNTLVEVEDMQILVINEKNENAWDQEDEILDTKNETNMLIDDIIANNLDSDNDRTANLVLVENINQSYVDRETRNQNVQNQEILDMRDYTEQMELDIQANKLESDKPRQDTELIVENIIVAYQTNNENHQKDQYNKNHEVTNEVEDMTIQIQENNYDNDQPRVEMEVLVEEMEVDNTANLTRMGTNQTDIVMSNDEKIEKIEMKIQDHNAEMGADREGYEEVVVEIQDDLTDYKEELVDKNKDNVHDVKAHTEEMQDDKEVFNEKMAKNADIQTDKNIDAIEDYNEVVRDKKEQTNDALIKSEEQIEVQKENKLDLNRPVLENELGQKYPEGVTEESFAINDSNGLLKAYVVRRIVVKGGAGTVYEKTQARHGTMTYTRDGEPISEYMWSDETSAASTTQN